MSGWFAKQETPRLISAEAYMLSSGRQTKRLVRQQNKALTEHLTMQSKTSYLYFVEKMSGVLSELLTHPGTARQRLMSVRIELFLHLPKPMPTEYSKHRWQFVNEKLSKKPDAFGQPAIANSIKSMRESTASKVIGAIRDTVDEVSSYQDAN